MSCFHFVLGSEAKQSQYQPWWCHGSNKRRVRKWFPFFFKNTLAEFLPKVSASPFENQFCFSISNKRTKRLPEGSSMVYESIPELEPGLKSGLTIYGRGNSEKSLLAIGVPSRQWQSRLLGSLGRLGKMYRAEAVALRALTHVRVPRFHPQHHTLPKSSTKCGLQTKQ